MRFIMTLVELDAYFKEFLQPQNYSADPSLNGIQIENSAPDSKQIKKIAFAVDACQETALKAAEWGADLLFVHHGLFWNGSVEKLTGHFYKKISAFLNNDLALYGMHIPLDANNPYGNNWGMAARLGLKECEPFGEWRGMFVGVKGKLPSKMSIEELTKAALNPGEKPLYVFNAGVKEIESVAIISGGAADDVSQAIEENIDCFITGEFDHCKYHYVKESGINLIAGGHYQTETIGVCLVMKKVSEELGLETKFIDVPTGL